LHHPFVCGEALVVVAGHCHERFGPASYFPVERRRLRVGGRGGEGREGRKEGGRGNNPLERVVLEEIKEGVKESWKDGSSSLADPNNNPTTYLHALPESVVFHCEQGQVPLNRTTQDTRPELLSSFL